MQYKYNFQENRKKNQSFPVSLVHHYTSSDKELFPLRNETPLEVPPLDQSEEKKVLKLFKERLRGKMKKNTWSGTKLHNIKMNGLLKLKYLIPKGFSEDSNMREDALINKVFELCALHT
ncbi:hypothetical protein O181_079681 [Austropuccinia psidii MF-1]|uniref:Uncharacterized protein n=1 Tax=Austropuccinia psidii MF-1 TaxID=1389203 RepID=A0A9Q3IE70_9BASI|nr:hypothetical protein [Austropuccinia psidii MF-1]